MSSFLSTGKPRNLAAKIFHAWRKKTPWKINLFAKADPIISERILPIVLQIPCQQALNQAAKPRGSFQYLNP